MDAKVPSMGNFPRKNRVQKNQMSNGGAIDLAAVIELGENGAAAHTHQERSLAGSRSQSPDPLLPGSSRRASGGWLRWISPQAWRWIRRALLVHIPVIALTLALLFTVGTLVLYRNMPEPYTLDSLTFAPYQVDPRSLQPFDPDFGEYNILLEPHLHSTFTDGRLPIDKGMEWALAMGFNAIVVTDHNNVESALLAVDLSASDDRFRGKLVVVPGMEYTSCRAHMNLIGLELPRNETELNAWPESKRTAYQTLVRLATERPVPTDEELKQLVDSAHVLGAVVSINHIPWSTNAYPSWGRREPTLPNHPNRTLLHEMGVDFMEVVNGDTMDYVSIQYIQQQQQQQQQQRAIGMLTGTDMHYPVLPHAWTILHAKNRTREGIMEQLYQRRTSFLFDAGTTTIPTEAMQQWQLEGERNPTFETLLPWGALGDFVNMFYEYRRAMPSFQGTQCAANLMHVRSRTILLFIVYAVVVFIGMELLCYVWACYLFPWIRARWRRTHKRRIV